MRVALLVVRLAPLAGQRYDHGACLVVDVVGFMSWSRLMAFGSITRLSRLTSRKPTLANKPRHSRARG